MADREEIFRGLAESLEYKEIAVRIGRDASVVSREVARHGGRDAYRAERAQGGRGRGSDAADGVGGGPGPGAAGSGGQVVADRLVTGLDRGLVGA